MRDRAKFANNEYRHDRTIPEMIRNSNPMPPLRAIRFRGRMNFVVIRWHVRIFRVMSTLISPLRPTIIYPDSDGQPMSDNTLQFRWIVTIEGGLEAIYRDDPNVFVAGDLLWYPVERKPTIRKAPDVMVVFGRPKGDRGSYMQWEENGIAPQVVFEILSPGNRAGEMETKFQFYERYGVEEYYIYDPDRGDLVGWLRVGQTLEQIPDMNGFESPRLKIRFQPGEGPNNLKIIGPDGEPFATYLEVIAQREAERQRADDERQRADDERRLAEAERQRADRLAARLRELGVEPD
jgi:Uma2 family endonuclease